MESHRSVLDNAAAYSRANHRAGEEGWYVHVLISQIEPQSSRTWAGVADQEMIFPQKSQRKTGRRDDSRRKIWGFFYQHKEEWILAKQHLRINCLRFCLRKVGNKLGWGIQLFVLDSHVNSRQGRVLSNENKNKFKRSKDYGNGN